MTIDLKEKAGSAMNVQSQLSESLGDPQVTLGALAFADDLGRLLWRMKYGQDVRRSGLHRATLLLAKRIRTTGKFKRSRFTGYDKADRRNQALGKEVDRSNADIVDLFARRLIIEWVADVCSRCNGRRLLGIVVVTHPVDAVCGECVGVGRVCVSEERIPFAAGPNGPLVFREWARCGTCNGRRSVLNFTGTRKAERTQICPHCAGTGREPVDEPARASALGVSLDVYRRRWAELFSAMLALLDQIDGRAGDVVRSQMQSR